MRVSALRHRVAGEALPGFGDAASFASRTAGHWNSVKDKKT
jgi:hypothetical protein